MSTYLNWGILSTARINRRLIPAIRAAERAELIAVASRGQSRAEAYAREQDIPRAYGSYEALLDDPDVDVVYVSVPNSEHATWAIKAIESGKHVLCEKPLAPTVAECDRIISSASAADVVAMEAIMVYYHPLHQTARQLVRDGAVGELLVVRGCFSFFLDRPADVRWQPTLGGGALWDVGTYPVSFIRWIVGEPDRVFGWHLRSDSGVDRMFAGLLHYDGGTLGVFECGFQGPFRTVAEVVGTEGTLVIERPWLICQDSRLLLRGRDKPEEAKEIPVPQIDAYRCEVDALTAAVLDGAELAVPLGSSRANIATVGALYRSAEQGESLPPLRGNA